jgi:adenine phosphoribosyltransferase
VDKIVTPAAMGIHISTAVSLMTDIPLVVVRKRQYGLEGEVALSQVTGYSASEMYINDVEPGDRVLVLDDVLSTGGTLTAITGALDEIGAEISDVLAVIKKEGGENRLEETDYDAKTLINVDVVDGEVVVVDEDGDG